ncbi:MAG: DNA-binding protein [Deltaproteobacteria bacterium RIFOXYD12_FULL_57_12]|nr:MAG: DNA-binding protein [Deltaproteobacteria bacterium RIFOXYD12_FULL_57_12]
MTLTKADLIRKVHATHLNLAREEARNAVEAFLDILKSSLEDGNDILLSGFGKFNVRDKAARRGRNPQTGEELVLEPRRVVTFKPSGKLRERLNEK